MKLIQKIKQANIKYDHEDFDSISLISADLYGHLGDNGEIKNKEEVISDVFALIHDFSIEKVRTYFSNVIGNCSLILKKRNSFIYIINSSTSPGFFYKKTDSEITIRDEESKIFFDLKEVNISAFASSYLFHQGLIRDAENTVNKEWKYLCSGCDLYLDDFAKENRTFYFANQPPSKLSFSDLIESIIKCYTDSLRDVFLAKSGGIDSTCLAVAFSKVRKGGKLIHIPYFGDKTPAIETSKIIAQKLGLSIELAKPIKKINDSILSGLGIYFGPEYDKFGFDYLVESYENPTVITGQNLDSLYVVDSFAPSSNERGLIRQIKILFTVFKRLLFSNFLLRSLEVLDHKYKSRFTSKYVDTWLNGFREHRIPFFSKGVEDDFSELFQSRAKSYFDLLKPFEVSFNTRIRSLKYLKFVQNVHRNYFNLRMSKGVNRVNPFSEGPFVRFFLNYKLSFKDSFFIKKECTDYTKKNQIDYDQIASLKARTPIYYFIRSIFFLMPLKIQIFLSGVFSVKSNQYIFSIKSEDIEQIDLTLNFLSQRKNKYSSVIMKKLESLKSKKNINKEDKMLLYRLKNLNSLISEYS